MASTLRGNGTEVDEYWILSDINAGIECTAHIVLSVGPKNRTTLPRMMVGVSGVKELLLFGDNEISQVGNGVFDSCIIKGNHRLIGYLEKGN